MFTVNESTFEVTQATEGNNLVTCVVDLQEKFAVGTLHRLAEKYLGNRFAKGTSKEVACQILFPAICKALELEIPVEATVPKSEKQPKKERKMNKERIVWSKTYKLMNGRMPQTINNKIEAPWGDHATVITEAIAALVAAGTVEATRDVIMEKAVELKLYERRASKQGVAPIFSWWRKSLHTMGWIEAMPKPEKPVKEEKAEEKVEENVQESRT